MPDNFDERFSGLPVDAPSTPLISDIVGNAQIASPQFNLVPVDYDPFPKRRKGPAAFNDEPPSEMIRPDAPVADKMFGLNGKERYQFFPERLARSVYDIMSGQVAPYNPSTGEYNVEGAMDVAGLLGGAPLGIKPGTASLGSGAIRPIMNANKNEAVPAFFSAVEKAVTDISQPKMTGQQWLGTLSNKTGVKPEELDWIGLKDYLKENADKVVTKQEIESHVAANKVELKDIDKGSAALSKEELIKQYLEKGYQHHEAEYYASRDLQGPDKITETKYQSYQLPGGENYREKLLTLPNELKGEKAVQFDKFISEGRGDLAARLTKNLPEDYKSSHWDEPNVLAHVRMNDRTIEGKKSLHIEEIQSDWHQQGRQQGYKEANLNPGNYGNFARSKGYTNEQVQSTFHDFKDPVYREWQDKQDAYEKNISAVPDAPFKKTWHELALKRMLREAAEKGYDRLSWTPGEAQAARYDLSKQIDKIKLIPESNKNFGGSGGFKYRVDAFKNNERVVEQYIKDENELPNIVGKEVAKKLIENKHPIHGGSELSGLELKVGGEGMKGFYDQIIPKALEKIGKEHGVKVKQGKVKINDQGFLSGSDIMDSLGIPEHKQSAYWNNLTQKERDKLFEQHRSRNEPIHYIDIPQSLKDQAMHKGFPLFSGGFMLNPIDHDPFSKEKK